METRTLRCRLTERELLERGHRLASLHAEISSLEDARRSSASEYKSQIDLAEAQLSAIAREVRSGAQERQVEVRREKDFDRNVEEVIRLDTGEVVETRALTPQERQGELHLLAEASQ
jgi:hypothetical protein